MTRANLLQNLKLLCSYAPSISDACRDIGINRQQFTKYLNGTSHPSQRNMRRICDHFGVDEDELLAPPVRFAEMVALRPRAQNLLRALGPAAGTLDRMFTTSTHVLKPYVGYYFYYYFTPSRPGMIRCSLLRISARKDVFFTHLVERIQPQESPLGRSHFVRYLGVALSLNGRIFIIDHNARELRSISQTILFPSPTPEVRFLTGMTLGVQGRTARAPFASPVFLERIPACKPLRAMRQTGIFMPTSSHIPTHVSRILLAGSNVPQLLTAVELPI
jgi:transcriptional regulator with XRE-family HTH domain